jgi:hypothetical protein
VRDACTIGIKGSRNYIILPTVTAYLKTLNDIVAYNAKYYTG